MDAYASPTELADEFGITRRAVISFCIEHKLPIYNGRIEVAKFQAAWSTDQAGRGAHPGAEWAPDPTTSPANGGPVMPSLMVVLIAELQARGYRLVEPATPPVSAGVWTHPEWETSDKLFMALEDCLERERDAARPAQAD